MYNKKYRNYIDLCLSVYPLLCLSFIASIHPSIAVMDGTNPDWPL